VWARHILIKTVDDNMQELPQEKQDEAKKKSDELLIRAKNGEDFVQLVKDYSEDAVPHHFQIICLAYLNIFI
jgi:foldase protein PrsA